MSTNASSGYVWRLVALSLAMLLPSLGTSIANVALPSLQSAFDSPGQDVQWVVIAYLLAVTSLVVMAGRLGDLLGKRRLLLAGIGLFAAASIAATFAPQLWLLVLARGAQGVGAAAMMALAVAAVGDTVPKERTGSAMGLLGTVSAVGTAMGPSLGGVLLDTFGWPSVFAFMAAAGILAFALAYAVIPKYTPDSRSGGAFDFTGTALLIGSVAAFALATTLTPPSSINAVFAGIALSGATAFVLVERVVAVPLVQLRLLEDRAVSAGLMTIGLISAIMMTTLVVGPSFLTNVLGLGPAATGLVMTIGPAVAALVGIPAGRLVDHFGTASTTLVGLGGVLVGTLLMMWLPHAFAVTGYVASMVLITAGYALFQAANSTAVMVRAGTDRRGVTSALLSLARNLGLVAGASAMGSVFAFGSGGLQQLGLSSGGETGLRLAFLVAAILAGIALTIALRSVRPSGR